MYQIEEWGSQPECYVLVRPDGKIGLNKKEIKRVAEHADDLLDAGWGNYGVVAIHEDRRRMLALRDMMNGLDPTQVREHRRQGRLIGGHTRAKPSVTG